jgi:hypothetical protein
LGSRVSEGGEIEVPEQQTTIRRMQRMRAQVRRCIAEAARAGDQQLDHGRQEGAGCSGQEGSGMSDRLVLANAIEDAGIPRAKAPSASVIFDAIHDNVVTPRPPRHRSPAAAARL